MDKKHNNEIKFESTGLPAELVVDNGNGYQTTDLCHGDNKDPEEINSVSKKKVLDNN
jgi:hypothetical protein